MLRDSETVRWQGTLMFKHKKLLRNDSKNDYKLSHPHPDETQAKEMEQLLIKSLQENTLLKVCRKTLC
ncbi:hypothetical protein MKZ02_23840 [Pseudobacillus sp. FSL P4-0506]|uniref:hypothetical protein n=1 Tax=Pseudobacillus sp. FSL P4-0506 TaxID=2921576 RepID=UPI0030F6EAA3